MASQYDTSVKEESLDIGSKALHTASFILLSKAVSFIFLGLSFIVVVRLLGPSNYGVYTLAFAAAAFFSIAGNFGLGTAMNKLVPQHIYKKEKKLVENLLSNGFSVTVLLSVAATIIAIMLSGFVASYIFHAKSDTLALQIASITVLTSIMYSTAYSVLLGFNNGKALAAMAMLQSVVQSVLSVALVLLGFGAPGAIAGVVFGQAAATLLSLYYIYNKNRLRFVAPRISGIKRLFSFAGPIGFSNLFTSICGTIPVILLGAVAASAVLGNYGVAGKVNTLIDVVAGSISLSILSMFSTALVSKSKRSISKFYNYTVYYSVLIMAPVLLFVAVLAKPFSYVAFSGMYTIAPTYIAIIAIGILIGLAGSYASQLLIGAKKVRDYLKYNIIISIVEIVLAFILVPIFKGIGLVLVIFLILPIITDILFIRRTAQLFTLNFDIGKLSRILISNIIPILMLLPLWIFWKYNFIPLLITGVIDIIVLYPINLGLFKGIDRGDIKRLREITKGIPVINALISAFAYYTNVFLR